MHSPANKQMNCLTHSLLMCTLLLGILAAPSPKSSESSESHEDPHPSPKNSCAPPKPTFLKDVSGRSKGAFEKILHDKSLSREQFEIKAENWASKESEEVQEKVRQYLDGINEKIAEHAQGVKDVQNAVSEVLANVELVISDPNISKKEMEKRVNYIIKKAPKKIGHLAKEVLEAVQCKPIPSSTAAPEPDTEAPETKAPETEAPETGAPETEAPGTEAPETPTEDSNSPNVELIQM